ncbi:phosphatase PAP2 family protein [Yinghuangia seranimata]|uniref:phosphatase PAP2 family protein n=1 Tax=Yinghuangia seranimata TaxID=408067 RepID=UPI00248CF371|nr:phosphatase PAP2 family protein [Yinghuangia seranimata]MDI2131723.1 phosphatase PAP2 family protein [Yinghuangia seranimata]
MTLHAVPAAVTDAAPVPLASGDNADLDVLRGVNGLADHTTWANGFMEFLGEYGLLAALGVVLGIAWFRARRRPDNDVAVAGVLWAPLAALIAELANMPLRDLVDRPRPFVTHADITVLVEGKDDPSFASDHALLTMAIAVALLLVDRRLGAVAALIAVLQGFCRLYVGVHYPTDVLGGFALGALVALALSPLALRGLIPVVRKAEGTVLRPLVTARAAA